MGVVVTTSRRATPSPFASAPVEFDTFRVAIGLAIVVGALSVAADYLDVLVLTLVALGTTGWVAGHLRGAALPTVRVDWTHVVGFALAGSGLAFYFLAAPPFSAFRGLLLGLAWLPLWGSERRWAGTSYRAGGPAS